VSVSAHRTRPKGSTADAAIDRSTLVSLTALMSPTSVAATIPSGAQTHECGLIRRVLPRQARGRWKGAASYGRVGREAIWHSIAAHVNMTKRYRSAIVMWSPIRSVGHRAARRASRSASPKFITAARLPVDGGGIVGSMRRGGSKLDGSGKKRRRPSRDCVARSEYSGRDAARWPPVPGSCRRG
jgi:hypothetical protein